MKISTISFLLSLLHFCVWGNDKTIRFRSVSNLNQAIELANKENKLILIDCYTQWCGPCKQMDKAVFTNEELGDFYNQNFICVKADMETKQWKPLAENFPIYGYPTFLFIDSKKNLQHIKTGGCYVNEFIELGKTAMDYDNNFFASNRKFQLGDRSAKTLRNLFTVDLQNKYKKQATFDFIQNAETNDLYSNDAWNFLTTGRNYPDSIFKNFILQEYQNYYSSVGEKEVIKYIELIWSWGIMKQGKKQYRKLEKESYTHPILPQVLARYNVSHASDMYNLLPTSGNAKRLVNQANDYMKYTFKDGYFLNEIAWYVYKKYTKHKNPDYLKSALVWAEASIEDEITSMNLETKANILYLLGNKEEAIEVQTKALEIAKAGDNKWGTSVKTLEYTLNKFRQNKKTE